MRTNLFLQTFATLWCPQKLFRCVRCLKGKTARTHFDFETLRRDRGCQQLKIQGNKGIQGNKLQYTSWTDFGNKELALIRFTLKIF